MTEASLPADGPLITGGTVFVTDRLEPPGGIKHRLGDAQTRVHIPVVVFDVEAPGKLPPFIENPCGDLFRMLCQKGSATSLVSLFPKGRRP